MKKLLLVVFVNFVAILYSQNNRVFIDAEQNFTSYYKEVKTWHDGSVLNESKADGYIYVKTNGKYYVVEDYYMGNVINAKLFGVKADGVTDDTKSLQKAFDVCSAYGTTLFLPQGIIKTSGDIRINTTNKLKQKIRIVGSGISNTIILNTGSSTKIALTVTGTYYDMLEMRDFRIERPNGGSASGGVGLKIEKEVYTSLENIDIFRFDTGLVLNDVSTLYMKNVNTRWGNKGMVFKLENPGGSNPNLIEMHSCVINSNKEWGISLTNPHVVSFYNCCVEDNGLGGINVVYNNTNGANSINVDGSYFEGNSGYDVYIKSLGAGTHTFKGNSFNRVSDKKFVKHHIVLEIDNALPSGYENTLDMRGNGFFSAGTYISNAGNEAVKILSNKKKVKVYDSNNYRSLIEKPKYNSDIQVAN